jgi:hypothetical protein
MEIALQDHKRVRGNPPPRLEMQPLAIVFLDLGLGTVVPMDG